MITLTELDFDWDDDAEDCVASDYCSICLNPDYIVSMHPTKDGTDIWMSNGQDFAVKETLSEIQEKLRQPPKEDFLQKFNDTLKIELTGIREAITSYQSPL